MGISHDGYVFTGKAGCFEEGPPELPLQVLSAPGVYGCSHLIGPIMSRPFRCRYWLDGIVSLNLLTAAVSNMNLQAGRLTGTVIRDGFAATGYGSSTFLGFIPDGPPFYSAGGIEGWTQFGTLNWIQRRL